MMDKFFGGPISRYMVALLVVWIGIFILTTGLPDASIVVSGGKANAQNIKHVREELHLDKPVWKRFGFLWTQMLKGELKSYYHSEPLQRVLAQKIGISFKLLLSSLISLFFLCCSWIFVLYKFRNSTWTASVLMGITSSIPLFITLPLILFLCGRYDISPFIGGGVCLAIYPSMLLATNLVDISGKKKTPPLYQILAKQCGLRGKALFAMKLRTAYSAVQILLNSIVFFIVLGIPVAEFMLGIPGAGRWMLESILRIDLPVVYICAAFSAFVCALFFFFDEVYSFWAGADI
jgi:ABC-type dipeptide/oligopeptide/nickel transport system permease component